MNRFIYSLTILLFVSSALAGPKGTVPRRSASQYPVHAQGNGTSVGARLLSREEARKTFVSDVNRCCIIVEVAFYPDNAKAVTVSLNDFVLRQKNTQLALKPSSPKVVAASLQQKAQGDRDIVVSPSTGIGYGSGTVYDPNTGTPRRTSSVYTQAGVGVAVGGSTGPGTSDEDRSVMETELTEKGLAEGATSTPVAGYIYFPLSKKKGDCQLEYVSDGNKLVLPIRASLSDP